PNTGGMGAVSPSPYLNSELEAKIKTQIVAPILKTFVEEKIDFRGVLYIGIMIDRHQNPWVLEFNTRFGDPETQSLMMRMNDDLTPLLLATAKGQLATAAPLRWTDQTAVYVVGAAQGYPDKVLTGSPISGWETTSSDTQIFFSSVELKNQTLVTAGGRVLGVGALGNNVEEARTKAYQRLKNIAWEGIHYRKDIGLTR
ncbi:MAG: phosphoribosylamine--glycine ligase, partial [Deltaproteobacteria bacterium]